MNRATGVEYLSGERLYRAHAKPNDAAGAVRQARASREVVLAGGAFNTPQLLMLSGIGPRAELEAQRIPVRVDLPGVGRNLQDRYEVAVVNRMSFDAWEPLRDAKFNRDDPQFKEWTNDRRGVFTTNGVVLSVIARSTNESVLLRSHWQLPGLLSGILDARREKPQLLHLGRAQGAHEQYGRHRDAAIRGPARRAGREFQLLRRGQ